MLQWAPSVQAASLDTSDDVRLDFALPVHPVTVTVLDESDQPVKGAGPQGPADFLVTPPAGDSRCAVAGLAGVSVSGARDVHVKLAPDLTWTQAWGTVPV